MRTCRPLSAFRALLANRNGGAAVEFGILGPILGLVFAGVIDLGGVVFVKFGLDNAVSAGANFAIVNKANVSSTGGPTLASSIAAIVANGSNVEGTIVVNNGPTATIASGAVQSSGVASNANSCYCPTLSSSVVAWGSVTACGSACTGGGKAGKFVTITTSRGYTPLFSNYGFVDNATISASAVVQTE